MKKKNRFHGIKVSSAIASCNTHNFIRGVTLSSKSQVSYWEVFVWFVFLLIKWSVAPEKTEFPCNFPSEILSTETIETNSILILLWIAQTHKKFTGEKASNVSRRFYRKKTQSEQPRLTPLLSMHIMGSGKKCISIISLKLSHINWQRSSLVSFLFYIS